VQGSVSHRAGVVINWVKVRVKERQVAVLSKQHTKLTPMGFNGSKMTSLKRQLRFSAT